MKYYSFQFSEWATNHQFPNLLLGDGELIFDATNINFGEELPENLLSTDLSNHLSVKYQINVLKNGLDMSMFRIEADPNLFMIFFTSVVVESNSFYPNRIPEGVVISQNGNLKFYRIYTIYELSTSYLGLLFGDSPKYLLKEEPTLDIRLSKFNINSIESITSMFKFDFAFNGVSRINIHNAITSIFRNPGEPNSLVPPISI